jgi:hypothetical protein
MRLELQATPEEIREKSGQLLERLGELLGDGIPEFTDALEKALPAKEPALKYPVLRELAVRTRDLYQGQIEKMLREISEVINESVAFQKSGEEDLEKGGLFIGPKGGKWADPQHTIHWTGGQPEKSRQMAHEPKPEDIKPFPDNAAAALLASFGDLLYGLQHGMHNVIDDTGLNQYDFGYWHSVRGNISGMRKMLKKYKGQILSHFGPAAYFQAGLHLVQKTEGLKVQPQYHETFGSLMLPLDGFFKGDFKKYCSVVKEKYGAQFDGNKKCFYIPKLSVVNFDFAAYKEDMQKFGIEVAAPIGTPPKISPAGEAAVDYKPESIEELIKGIHSYHVKDVLVVRLREDGIFEFHSPYAPAFNTLFANKGGQLSGITKYNPVTKVRETFDLDLTEEAIEKLKVLFPKWKIVTQGVKEARIKRDQEIAELQKPIPEVQQKLDPKFKLMSYQNEGVRFLDKANGNALIGDEMGLGKTLETLAWAAKNDKKVLVVCPKVVRKNWLEEAHKFFPGHFKGAELVSSQLKKGQVPDLSGCNIAVVNYESLAKFEDAIKAGGFDTIIIDECFGPETLIDTPRGQVPIAQIQVGDEVYSAVGISKVTGIGQKRVDGHVVLRYGGQEIRCSPCHPFFTNRGWVPAERLTLEDRLAPHSEAMRLLFQGVHDLGSPTAFLRELLCVEVENDPAFNSGQDFYARAFQKGGGSQPGQEKPGERQTHARAKSYVAIRGAREGLRRFAAHAASAASALRKWLWPDSRREFALEAAGAGVEAQSRGELGQTPGWLSDQLQAGSGLGIAEARRRSGWLLALCSIQKSAGPEERAQIAGIRLDGIEVHESGSYPGNEAGLYYDLRVAGHPSYCVNGVLVHNSHRMKNPKAQATQNIQKIGAFMKHHILLSGTAIKNKKEELFTQLDMVAPGKFTKNAIKTAPIGGLWMDMHSVYIARAKSTVLKDLPEKTTSIVKHPVPGLPDMGNENTVGAISKLKAEIAKGKTPVTKAMVQEILDTSDSKVLVFTDSVEAAKTLNEAFPEDSILHHGQLSDANRDAAVKEFQKKDEAGNFISTKRVFVTTRQSMAVGATLTAADKVVFNDLPWTAADVRQAEDRAHRIGQKNAVNVYWMTAEGNLFDENVNDILRRKYELGQKLNQGKQLTAAEMTWLSSSISIEELIAQIHGQAAGPKGGPSAEDAEEPPPPQVPAAEDMSHPELAPPLPEPQTAGTEILPGSAVVIDVPIPEKPKEPAPAPAPKLAEAPPHVAPVVEKKPVPAKAPVAAPGPAPAPTHSFEAFLQKYGVKIREHKTDPTKVMIKVPKHESEATAKLKAYGIDEASFEGGQYHLITVPKQKVKDLLFGKSLDDFLELDAPEQLKLFKGGMFIGPRGGKWADPEHTIPWSEEGPGRSAGGADAQPAPSPPPQASQPPPQVSAPTPAAEVTPPAGGDPQAYQVDPSADADGDGVADAARVGMPGKIVAPPPTIPRLPNLTADERAVEGKFAGAFEADPDGMAAAFYDTAKKNNFIFETDAAKSMMPEWTRPDLPADEKGKPIHPERAQARALYNTALHQTANAVVKRAFIQRLDEIAKMPEGERKILVTSGGVAGGKGSALGARPELAQSVAATWDAAGEQNGTENPWLMEECEKRGIKPVFLFVSADPGATWPGAVERAKSIGRMVDARVFADSYAYGAKNFSAFHDKNKDKATFVFAKAKKGDPVQFLDQMPPEALSVDADALYGQAMQYIQSKAAELAPHIVSGAMAGSRIWGGA